MGSSSKTTKVEATPWAPAQPYITGSLEASKVANEQGTKIYGDNMGGINAAIAKINQNIATPPQYQTDARNQLDKTINGDYINANPHTGALADLIAQKTGAQYNSTFGAAGRAHGGLSALLSGQGVGDALQQFYGNQYNQERANQMQAIGMAPGFNADEYTGTNQLLNTVGNAAILPGQIAGNYANTVTNATSPYVQKLQTEKTNPSLLQNIATAVGIASQIAGAAATGGASLIPQAAMAGMGGGSGGLSGLLGGGFSALTPRPSFLG